MSIRRQPTITVSSEAGHSVCHDLDSVSTVNVWFLKVSPRAPCFSLGNESFPIFKADASAHEDANRPQLVAWEAESSPSWVFIKSGGGVIFFLSLVLFKRIYRTFWGGEKCWFLTQQALGWQLEELLDFFIFVPHELQRCLGLWPSDYSFQEGCSCSSWIGKGGFLTLVNLRRVGSFAVRTTEKCVFLAVEGVIRETNWILVWSWSPFH